MTKFLDLGLSQPILRALEDENYSTPTPIQAKAIPAVIGGSDLLGIAQTGTGKTAAFALPILDRLATHRQSAAPRGCRVLVISPTRELASQIAESFRVYGRHMRLRVTTVFGGMPKRPQVRALAQGVDILIATPGRLLDHMSERVINLNKTEILVLDEADQMLDLGFVKPIRNIVATLPKQRQTLFFSATMPKEISRLAHEFLTDPVTVKVTPVASTVELISQRVIHIESAKKRALLAELLADPAMSRTLVFTRTKRGADRVAKHLDARDISVAAIHGNKSQRQRERALDAFKKAKIRVLVATDIAARGIDVDAVSHVINFELPEVPEAYVHRIGRTARAGASGSAISLCDASERKLLRAIERLTRQRVPSEDRLNDGELEVEKAEPRARRGQRERTAGRAGSRSGQNTSQNARRRKPRRNASQSRWSPEEQKQQTSSGRNRGKPNAAKADPAEGSVSSLEDVDFLRSPDFKPRPDGHKTRKRRSKANRNRTQGRPEEKGNRQKSNGQKSEGHKAGERRDGAQRTSETAGRSPGKPNGPGRNNRKRGRKKPSRVSSRVPA